MLRKYLNKLQQDAYAEGFRNGIAEGTRTERQGVYQMLERNRDMEAFQESAKSKTTKAASDGMKLGYDYALGLVQSRSRA